MTAVQVLRQWLHARLPAPALDWLVRGLDAGEIADRDLYLRIGLVARQVGKAPLALSEAERAAAAASRPGWDPRDWTVDQAARVFLLCAGSADGARLAQRLERLCGAADVGELVAYYRGLPLYPDPQRHALRAAEGVRSNMRVVFEAVAHRNPYPAEQLSEAAWNQMVLKALFVGSPLAPIVGLDARRNAALAAMLVDYAHERRAAARPVSPELWRCVGPFAAGPLLVDLAGLLDSGAAAERGAAILALSEASDPTARSLLAAHAPAVDRDTLASAWERLVAA